MVTAFGARGWVSMTRSEKFEPITNAVMIGFQPHIEVAEYVLHFLIRGLNHDMKAYRAQMLFERKRDGKPALKPKTVNARLDAFAMGWAMAWSRSYRPPSRRAPSSPAPGVRR